MIAVHSGYHRRAASLTCSTNCVVASCWRDENEFRRRALTFCSLVGWLVGWLGEGRWSRWSRWSSRNRSSWSSRWSSRNTVSEDGRTDSRRYRMALPVGGADWCARRWPYASSAGSSRGGAAVVPTPRGHGRPPATSRRGHPRRHQLGPDHHHHHRRLGLELDQFGGSCSAQSPARWGAFARCGEGGVGVCEREKQ